MVMSHCEEFCLDVLSKIGELVQERHTCIYVCIYIRHYTSIMNVLYPVMSFFFISFFVTLFHHFFLFCQRNFVCSYPRATWRCRIPLFAPTVQEVLCYILTFQFYRQQVQDSNPGPSTSECGTVEFRTIYTAHLILNDFITLTRI
jgi:hypothetical protein